MATKSISAQDGPKRYWEMIRHRYPEFNAIDTFLRRAPDISQRYGRVYCKAEWWLGPARGLSTQSTLSGSIPDVGVHQAILSIIEAKGVEHRHIYRVVQDLMPPCMHPGCQPACRGQAMPVTSNVHQP